MSDLFPEVKDWPGNRVPKNRSNKPAVSTTSHEELDLQGKFYTIKGERIELFTIGDLSAAIRKRPVTIRMWESKGWIPKANWRSPAPNGHTIPNIPARGRRLYTRQQVELLVRAADDFCLDNKAKADWTGFRAFVRTNWPI